MIGEIIECVLTGWFAFLLKEYIIVSTLFSSRGLQCSELWGLWKWERISEPSDHMASSHCRGLFFSCYQVVGRMGLLYEPLHWEDVLTVSIFMASSLKVFSRVLSSYSASKRSDHANNNSALVLFPEK